MPRGLLTRDSLYAHPDLYSDGPGYPVPSNGLCDGQPDGDSANVFGVNGACGSASALSSWRKRVERHERRHRDSYNQCVRSGGELQDKISELEGRLRPDRRKGCGGHLGRDEKDTPSRHGRGARAGDFPRRDVGTGGPGNCGRSSRLRPTATAASGVARKGPAKGGAERPRKGRGTDEREVRGGRGRGRDPRRPGRGAGGARLEGVRLGIGGSDGRRGLAVAGGRGRRKAARESAGGTFPDLVMAVRALETGRSGRSGTRWPRGWPGSSSVTPERMVRPPSSGWPRRRSTLRR